MTAAKEAPLRTEVRIEHLEKAKIGARKEVVQWALASGLSNMTVSQIEELQNMVEYLTGAAFATGFQIGANPVYRDQ